MCTLSLQHPSSGLFSPLFFFLIRAISFPFKSVLYHRKAHRTQCRIHDSSRIFTVFKKRNVTAAIIDFSKSGTILITGKVRKICCARATVGCQSSASIYGRWRSHGNGWFKKAPLPRFAFIWVGNNVCGDLVLRNTARFTDQNTLNVPGPAFKCDYIRIQNVRAEPQLRDDKRVGGEMWSTGARGKPSLPIMITGSENVVVIRDCVVK